MGDLLTFSIILACCQINTVLLLDLGLAKSLDNYGPFEIEIKRYEMCKGPRSKNSAIPYISIDKVTDEKGEGDYVYRGNITFLENASINEIKVKVLTVKGNKKTILLKYNVKQPCQHFMIAKVIGKFLNATNCSIKKGVYNFSMSFLDITESFFGKSFFYGEYEFRSSTTAAKGNIICMINNLVFKKPATKPSI